MMKGRRAVLSERAEHDHGVGIQLEPVEQRFQFAFLEPEVRFHDGRETLQMTRKQRGRLARPHSPVESGQKRGDHVVVLPEHADNACCLRVLLHQGGKQQRIFASVVAVESEAEAVAVEQEISRCVRDVSAIARGLLCGAKCETESFVNLEKLPSPRDEPRDVAHATMSV